MLAVGSDDYLHLPGQSFQFVGAGIRDDTDFPYRLNSAVNGSRMLQDEAAFAALESSGYAFHRHSTGGSLGIASSKHFAIAGALEIAMVDLSEAEAANVRGL